MQSFTKYSLNCFHLILIQPYISTSIDFIITQSISPQFPRRSLPFLGVKQVSVIFSTMVTNETHINTSLPVQYLCLIASTLTIPCIIQ